MDKAALTQQLGGAVMDMVDRIADNILVDDGVEDIHIG